jgi:hypothetical protein
MKSYFVEPEVAGSLGDRTIMNRSVHPPIVKRLHYQLEGWLGDVILESFPAFIVTDEAKQVLQKMGATGAKFDMVEVTATDQFEELYSDRKLPTFAWLKPEGKAGQDDIATATDGRLVVSRRALDALSGLGISHALVEPFERQEVGN